MQIILLTQIFSRTEDENLPLLQGMLVILCYFLAPPATMHFETDIV